MPESSPADAELDGLVDRALAEDTGHGDITTRALIPPDLCGKASVQAKAAGRLAGAEVARRVFARLDPSLTVALLRRDGDALEPGDVIATVSGSVGSILKGERVALNFLQRLSGIASLTAQYAAAVAGTGAKIYDTRKTTPGLRLLEKEAVRRGGGHNHRFHLGDAVLIKDNHLAARQALGLGLKGMVVKARENAPAGTTVEVEVTSLEEAREALGAGADVILLDNMSPDEMRPVAAEVGGRARLEASGGITLANVRAVAETGVNIISIGALTHSAPALDISLELEPPTLRRT